MEPDPLVDPHAKDTGALFNPAEAVPEVGAEGTPYGVTEFKVIVDENPPITVYTLNKMV